MADGPGEQPDGSSEGADGPAAGGRRASGQPLGESMATLRGWLLDDDRLVRAVGSGRRRDGRPRWRRVELRYVDLRAGRHLQVTAYDHTQAHTANHRAGAEAGAAIDALLTEPFGSWHVETTTRTHQARVSKRGELRVHSRDLPAPTAPDREHDRSKGRLLPPDDPLLVALGISDRSGAVKPSRQAKYRQVEEFLRLLDATLLEALATGHLRRPTVQEPLRVVDLGCGNGYLTFAAQRFLSVERGLPVAVTGVDAKEQAGRHHAALAARTGVDVDVVVGAIGEVTLEPAPDVVLALHACDTATDDALARAVGWQAPVILAAPCCHHDLAAQLRRQPPPAPYTLLTRHGILRERLADTLTDGLRAALLRRHGYRVDVVEFVGSRHTPRNTLLRAVRTGAGQAGAARAGDRAGRECDELVAAWGVRPRLAELLGHA